MSHTSIFGHDLSDHEVEIVLHNPAVATWFADSRKQQELLNKWRHDRSARGLLTKLLGSIATAVGVGATVKAAITGTGERGPKGTSFYNLQDATRTIRRRIP